MTHDQRLVLAQTAVSATTSQVPGRTDLLAGVDLAGAVLTVEARNPVRATATWRHAHGADFVLTVQENIPQLFAARDALAGDDAPSRQESTERTPGRITRRTIQTLPAPPDLPFRTPPRRS